MSKDSSAKYYQEKKERFRKKACERYQDFPEGKKKRQCGRELYKNFPEEEKQRLVDYRKNYHNVCKNKTTSQAKTDFCLLT